MLMDIYNLLNQQLADSRVANSFWYGSPFPVIALCICYWIAIRHALPKFMEKRQAYQLKSLLQAYNLLQIVLCFGIFAQFMNSGFQVNYLWTCIGPDYSMNPVALNQLAAFKFTHVVKIVDLLETLFFCFRKKSGQISFLHVYHHISTLLFTWVVCKYAGGGNFAFCIVINAIVHLIMYTYYFLSSCGGDIQKLVTKFKPIVTIVQLVQLTFMVISHLIILMTPTCSNPKIISVAGVINILFLIKLFSDFYAQAYTRKKKEVQK